MMQGLLSPNCGGSATHLCAHAAVEQDPQKLMELVREIDGLLGEKMDRLIKTPTE